jgi:hypothetical protein
MGAANPAPFPLRKLYIAFSPSRAGRLSIRPIHFIATQRGREDSMRTIMRLPIAIALCALGANAQLKDGSLSIKGGETFTVGQKVPVTLTQLKPGTGARSGKYDFYISVNGGTSWTEMVGNWQGPTTDNATVTWEWNVTQAPTTKGVFRACLLSGGECSDAAYTLKSGNFTISNSTALAPSPAGSAGKLEFDAATGGMAVGFSLASPARVTLQAFDAQGRSLAVLLDADQAAGEHSLSLFSNRLQAMHGSVVFKLAWEGSSLTRAFVLP